MSQYPSPYEPPNAYTGYMYAWGEYQRLIAPFRRASLLMFILGALGLLLGGCFGAVGGFMRWDQLPPEMAQMVQEVESSAQMSMRTMMAIWAVMVSVPSILLIVMGVFVRRGSRAAVIGSMVLVGLILVFLVLNLLSAMAMAGRGGPQALGGVCMAAVMLALFGLLMGWLVQASRAVASLQMAQAQYQNQYWQYMRQQQGQMGQPMSPPPPPPAQDQGPSGAV